MAVFTWTPDKNVPGTFKPRVRAAAYGDGYTQRVRDGINTMEASYKVTFSLMKLVDYQAIMAFLDSHGGTTAFDWTPPGKTAGRYLCEEWSDDTDGITWSISATFKRVYGQ